MSNHPRSKRGKKIDKDEIAEDLGERYFDGITTPKEYDEEGKYSLFSVRTNYGDYNEALNDIGLPSQREIEGIIEELEVIKRKKGRVDEDLYEELGFFRSDAIPVLLDLTWDEIDELIQP